MQNLLRKDSGQAVEQMMDKVPGVEDPMRQLYGHQLRGAMAKGPGTGRSMASGGTTAEKLLTADEAAYLRDVASRTSLADRVAGFDTGLAVHLTVGAGQAERASAAVVTGDFFGVLGARPLAGRLIGPDDDRVPGGHPVAVLSEAFWSRRFAADTAVVGSVLRVNTTLFTVVGIAPRGFHGADVENAPDLWMPVSMIHEVSPLYAQFKPLERRGFAWLEAVAHLKSGATPAQAATEISGIIAGIPAPAPDAPAVTAVQRRPARAAAVSTVRMCMVWLL